MTYFQHSMREKDFRNIKVNFGTFSVLYDVSGTKSLFQSQNPRERSHNGTVTFMMMIL